MTVVREVEPFSGLVEDEALKGPEEPVPRNRLDFDSSAEVSRPVENRTLAIGEVGGTRWVNRQVGE